MAGISRIWDTKNGGVRGANYSTWAYFANEAKKIPAPVTSDKLLNFVLYGRHDGSKDQRDAEYSLLDKMPVTDTDTDVDTQNEQAVSLVIFYGYLLTGKADVASLSVDELKAVAVALNFGPNPEGHLPKAELDKIGVSAASDTRTQGLSAHLKTIDPKDWLSHIDPPTPASMQALKLALEKPDFSFEQVAHYLENPLTDILRDLPDNAEAVRHQLAAAHQIPGTHNEYNAPEFKVDFDIADYLTADIDAPAVGADESDRVAYARAVSERLNESKTDNTAQVLQRFKSTHGMLPAAALQVTDPVEIRNSEINRLASGEVVAAVQADFTASVRDLGELDTRKAVLYASSVREAMQPYQPFLKALAALPNNDSEAGQSATYTRIKTLANTLNPPQATQPQIQTLAARLIKPVPGRVLTSVQRQTHYSKTYAGLDLEGVYPERTVVEKARLKAKLNAFLAEFIELPAQDDAYTLPQSLEAAENAVAFRGKAQLLPYAQALLAKEDLVHAVRSDVLKKLITASEAEADGVAARLLKLDLSADPSHLIELSDALVEHLSQRLGAAGAGTTHHVSLALKLNALNDETKTSYRKIIQAINGAPVPADRQAAVFDNLVNLSADLSVAKLSDYVQILGQMTSAQVTGLGDNLRSFLEMCHVAKVADLSPTSNALLSPANISSLLTAVGIPNTPNTYHAFIAETAVEQLKLAGADGQSVMHNGIAAVLKLQDENTSVSHRKAQALYAAQSDSLKDAAGNVDQAAFTEAYRLTMSLDESQRLESGQVLFSFVAQKLANIVGARNVAAWQNANREELKDIAGILNTEGQDLTALATADFVMQAAARVSNPLKQADWAMFAAVHRATTLDGLYAVAVNLIQPQADGAPAKSDDELTAKMRRFKDQLGGADLVTAKSLIRSYLLSSSDKRAQFVDQLAQMDALHTSVEAKTFSEGEQRWQFAAAAANFATELQAKDGVQPTLEEALTQAILSAKSALGLNAPEVSWTPELQKQLQQSIRPQFKVAEADAAEAQRIEPTQDLGILFLSLVKPGGLLAQVAEYLKAPSDEAAEVAKPESMALQLALTAQRKDNAAHFGSVPLDISQEAKSFEFGEPDAETQLFIGPNYHQGRIANSDLTLGDLTAYNNFVSKIQERAKAQSLTNALGLTPEQARAALPVAPALPVGNTAELEDFIRRPTGSSERLDEDDSRLFVIEGKASTAYHSVSREELSKAAQYKAVAVFVTQHSVRASATSEESNAKVSENAKTLLERVRSDSILPEATEINDANRKAVFEHVFQAALSFYQVPVHLEAKLFERFQLNSRVHSATTLRDLAQVTARFMLIEQALHFSLQKALENAIPVGGDVADIEAVKEARLKAVGAALKSFVKIYPDLQADYAVLDAFIDSKIQALTTGRSNYEDFRTLLESNGENTVWHVIEQALDLKSQLNTLNDFATAEPDRLKANWQLALRAQDIEAEAGPNAFMRLSKAQRQNLFVTLKEAHSSVDQPLLKMLGLKSLVWDPRLQSASELTKKVSERARLVQTLSKELSDPIVVSHVELAKSLGCSDEHRSEAVRDKILAVQNDTALSPLAQAARLVELQPELLLLDWAQQNQDKLKGAASLLSEPGLKPEYEAAKDAEAKLALIKKAVQEQLRAHPALNRLEDGTLKNQLVEAAWRRIESQYDKSLDTDATFDAVLKSLSALSTPITGHWLDKAVFVAAAIERQLTPVNDEAAVDDEVSAGVPGSADPQHEVFCKLLQERVFASESDPLIYQFTREDDGTIIASDFASQAYAHNRVDSEADENRNPIPDTVGLRALKGRLASVEAGFSFFRDHAKTDLDQNELKAALEVLLQDRYIDFESLPEALKAQDDIKLNGKEITLEALLERMNAKREALLTAMPEMTNGANAESILKALRRQAGESNLYEQLLSLGQLFVKASELTATPSTYQTLNWKAHDEKGMNRVAARVMQSFERVYAPDKIHPTLKTTRQDGGSFSISVPQSAKTDGTHNTQALNVVFKRGEAGMSMEVNARRSQFGSAEKMAQVISSTFGEGNQFSFTGDSPVGMATLMKALLLTDSNKGFGLQAGALADLEENHPRAYAAVKQAIEDYKKGEFGPKTLTSEQRYERVQKMLEALAPEERSSLDGPQEALARAGLVGVDGPRPIVPPNRAGQGRPRAGSAASSTSVDSSSSSVSSADSAGLPFRAAAGAGSPPSGAGAPPLEADC